MFSGLHLVGTAYIFGKQCCVEGTGEAEQMAALTTEVRGLKQRERAGGCICCSALDLDFNISSDPPIIQNRPNNN